MNITDINLTGREIKEAIKHVLTLRQPSNRFDMHRMNGKKKGCDESDKPVTGQRQKQTENQKDIQDMERGGRFTGFLRGSSLIR